MLVSGKIQYVKNLLAINKKALIGLHNIAGMDFEKEFVILERFGKFTHNSIIKELNNITHGTGGCLIDCNHIFVIYQDNSAYGNGRFLLAKLTNKSFDSQRATIEGFEQSCGWRWFDTAIGKGTFEKIRKDKNCHYWIIAQERKYAVQSELKVVDYSVRYRTKVDYGSYYAIPYDKNGDWYYDSIARDYYGKPENFPDKSGYCNTNDYPTRVRKLKAERSAAEAATFDNTEKLKEFTERINHCNEALQIILAGNYLDIDYEKIYNVTSHLRWIKHHYKDLKLNKFKSVSAIQFTLERLEEDVSKAENVLKEDKIC